MVVATLKSCKVKLIGKYEGGLIWSTDILKFGRYLLLRRYLTYLVVRAVATYHPT